MDSNKKRYKVCFLVMICTLVIIFFIGMGVGSADISVVDISKSLINPGDVYMGRILLSIRLPRIIAAIVLGGALSGGKNKINLSASKVETNSFKTFSFGKFSKAVASIIILR